MEDISLEQRIKNAIDDIRPSLQNDGGDIEFVKLDGKTVSVNLVGSCAGCPFSQMTLKNGVERYLKHVVDPDIIVDNSVAMPQ